MQRDFQNKTVVITGACRGIGAGIAERFARDGANLVMVSNAERVHETAETLRQRYQADILSLQVDVTDEAQVQGLYEQAAARFGTIDVSIQNAGGDHHRLLRPDAKSRFRKSAGGQHHRRVAVLPRGGQNIW
ncbi:3-oxoacyl-ACP reductase [Klebsiella pneumoniae]|nr:3-oxoacyl-ACP reductase [Klebsiella pneumoniae]